MKSITRNLQEAVAQRLLPSITVYNRLEGRPRADKFERALRAEVRDALWMLTRQWQMGEFQGDDAGSPIFSKVRVETTRLRRYRPANGAPQYFDDGTPLEARVERLSVPFAQGEQELALDLRLSMGRHWLKLIASLPAAARAEYLTRYPIDPVNPLATDDASVCAHPEAWSVIAAVAGRRLDGGKLYFYLKEPPHRASDGIAALAGFEAQADALGDRFVAWFERLLHVPQASASETSTAAGSAWLPDRLEYQFDCSAPTGAPDGSQKVYAAEQYVHGHLDWYSFDVDPTRKSLENEGDPPLETPPDTTSSSTLTMLPTQVSFNGMPNTRWWAFEDNRTSFGDIKPDTTDLAKLMLIEFGLVYANDWYLIPFTVPAGSIANVRGMTVTNVFGERIWVEAAGRGDDDDWQRWALFLVSIRGKGHEPADLSLLVPPSAQATLEGKPREAVSFARDEMANMVWGIETTIALPTGEPKHGHEAARETRAFYERDLERRLGAPPTPPPFAEPAKIRYELMSTVPENWIPMIPAHMPNDNREIQLQRAAMPRILPGDSASPVPVRPRTSFLRTGLEQTPAVGYFLHEEEVPRAGAVVTQSFQRTRWRDGRAWLWLGARKRTGRGEGSSGLAFDRLVDRGD